MKQIKVVFITILLMIGLSFSVYAEGVEAEKSNLARFNEAVFSVIFYDISFGAIEVEAMNKDGSLIKDEQGNPKMRTIEVPLIVSMLFFGALFFTIFYRFINLRMFSHAIDVVRGRYDNPKDQGEISHFRALTSALSATVGLGNIAGVAVAIQTGGPGATFWMVIVAMFGMTSKFSSCTLSQLYRKINSNGSISGGPMYYIDMGLRDVSPMLAPFGKTLAIIYSVMVMGGALGGGNMFQVNQTAEAFRTTFNLGDQGNMAIGIMMLVVVAIVILGGIKRIGAATSKIIPFMCGLYVLASIVIIAMNAARIPETFALIFKYAFSSNAIFGGTLGVIVTGTTRAAFSNEAGLGSAAIVHAAAKTNEPVREGVVAMLGPFIDTVIICNMTALVVIVSGAWNDPSIPSSAGIALTTAAFKSALPWFHYILTASIALFAYSTMISWCYYGERGWIYFIDNVLGEGKGYKSVIGFRLIFLLFIMVGALNPLKDVLDFSDVMILSMAFPNIIASVILAPKVSKIVQDYVSRFKSGTMKTYH